MFSVIQLKMFTLLNDRRSLTNYPNAVEVYLQQNKLCSAESHSLGFLWFISKIKVAFNSAQEFVTHGEIKMATHIARSCLKYPRYGLSENLLYRTFRIGNERINKIAFCRSAAIHYGSRRQISSSVNIEDEQKKQEQENTRPKSHEDKMEEIIRVKPQKFDLSFGEYIKLKNSVRARQRVAGMPFALLGLGTSSVVSAYMFPEMFDATPENVQLIM